MRTTSQRDPVTGYLRESTDPTTGLQPTAMTPEDWAYLPPRPVKPAGANGPYVAQTSRDLAAESRPYLTGDPTCSHCGARLDPRWCNALAPDDVAALDARGCNAPASAAYDSIESGPD